jgi:hypothetical protein
VIAGVVALGWAWSTPGFAACSAPTSPVDVQRAVRAAEDAFGALDAAAFRSASEAADQALVCLDAPLTPPDAAAVHRMHALVAFFAGDHSGAAVSFQAMLAVEPGWQPSAALAQVGTDVAAARALAPSPMVPVPDTDGYVQIDGLRAAEYPSGRPFVAQGFDDGGAVRGTAYVVAGAPFPAGLVPRSEPAPAAHGVRGARIGLVAGGGALAAVSVGSFVRAASIEKHFYDVDSDGVTDTEAVRRTASGHDALVTTGLVGGVLSAASLGFAVAL